MFVGDFICVNSTVLIGEFPFTVGKSYAVFIDDDPSFFAIKNNNDVWHFIVKESFSEYFISPFEVRINKIKELV